MICNGHLIMVMNHVVTAIRIDGKIIAGSKSNDALNILQAVTGMVDLTDEQKKNADLDGDGNVTSADALYILQMVVGLI